MMRVSYNPIDWYWRIVGQEDRVYSSARMSMVPADDATYVEWLKQPCNMTSAVASMADLIQILRDANVPPYHRVRKSTVISRLTDEQLTAAISGMTVRQQERWRAPDQPLLNADDPDALAIIAAVGADPIVVMASES